MFDGFLFQIVIASFMTIKLALGAFFLGLPIGILCALFQFSSNKILRGLVNAFIFLVRGLPELLVLFSIYFGMTIFLSNLFHHYVDVNAFIAGLTALGLIFGAYASQVFYSAYLAIDHGQIEAARALNFNRLQLLFRIELPQVFRHAVPGLGNLWLSLVKDTAIVSLIGLPEMMSEAKIAASSTHQPFIFYLIVAFIYLIITTFSQALINYFTKRQSRYLLTS
jgi:His/Glu/Gln/Arg/opine family amino acid ABC transporter permease subunit